MKKILLFLGLMLTYTISLRSENFNYRYDKEVAVAHLYGYARYFNPNTALNALDWDKFLIYALRNSENIPVHSDSLHFFLENTFRPLLPDMLLTNSANLKGDSILKREDISNSSFVYKHIGFGSQKEFIGEETFSSEIAYVSPEGEMPLVDHFYSYKLTNGLFLHYPIAISEQNSSYDRELKSLMKKIDTIDLRLTRYSLLKVVAKKEYGYSPIAHQDNFLFKANLMNRWCIMKHFYPYLDEEGLTDAKMDLLLSTFLERIDNEIPSLSDNDPFLRLKCYYYLLKEFMASFKDGHMNENGIILGNKGKLAQQFHERAPLIALDFIEGSIVSRFDLMGKSLHGVDESKIKRGSKLLFVNDTPIDSLIRQKVKYIPSLGEEVVMARFLKEAFLTQKEDSLFTFIFKTSVGDTLLFKNTIADRSWGKVTKSYQKKNKFITNRGNGLFYVSLSSPEVGKKFFEDFVVSNSDSIKTLILDLREYPNQAALEVLGYLSNKPILWGDYRIPIRYFPNQENVVWKEEGDVIQSEVNALRNVSIYALINHNTFSFGESIANTLRKNKLATLVGTNSSGVNGDMTKVSIPVFSFIMTVGKDFDGYHAQGMTPDIVVEQTLNDYTNNKDTVLEFLIDRIKRLEME